MLVWDQLSDAATDAAGRRAPGPAALTLVLLVHHGLLNAGRHGCIARFAPRLSR